MVCAGKFGYCRDLSKYPLSRIRGVHWFYFLEGYNSILVLDLSLEPTYERELARHTGASCYRALYIRLEPTPTLYYNTPLYLTL